MRQLMPNPEERIRSILKYTASDPSVQALRNQALLCGIQEWRIRAAHHRRHQSLRELPEGGRLQEAETWRVTKDSFKWKGQRIAKVN
jgi:hypothetical protein